MRIQVQVLGMELLLKKINGVDFEDFFNNLNDSNQNYEDSVLLYILIC